MALTSLCGEEEDVGDHDDDDGDDDVDDEDEDDMVGW